MEMVFVAEFGRDTLVSILVCSHIHGEVPENAVEQVRGLEVGRVDHVVATLGMLLQPQTLIGSVVEDEVSQ